MLNINALFIVALILPSMVQCDITNLNEFLRTVNENIFHRYPVGFLLEASYEVIERYLPKNMHTVFFDDKAQLLEAVDKQTIIGKYSRYCLSHCALFS